MFSLNNISNLFQGIKITKDRKQSVYKWQIMKGQVVIGEAFCKNKKNKVHLQMIRRTNPVGKGLMSVLLKEIIIDAKKQQRNVEIEVKPFTDPNRPFESPSRARKRVYLWYKNFGFEINGENGIFRN